MRWDGLQLGTALRVPGWRRLIQMLSPFFADDMGPHGTVWCGFASGMPPACGGSSDDGGDKPSTDGIRLLWVISATDPQHHHLLGVDAPRFSLVSESSSNNLIKYSKQKTRIPWGVGRTKSRRKKQRHSCFLTLQGGERDSLVSLCPGGFHHEWLSGEGWGVYQPRARATAP